MDKRLFPEERLTTITQLIGQQGRVTVEEICSLFDISKVTARNDLDELSRRGLLMRTHGGAVAVDFKLDQDELGFSQRRQVNADAKRRIGQAAAQLVHDRDVIALDASTTALEVAKQVKRKQDLTVVTNSLPVTMEFLDIPGISVVVLGGTFRRDAISLVGDFCHDILERHKVRIAFLGAEGVTVEDGLTEISSAEAAVKIGMVQMAKEVSAVVDHTKLGRVSFVTFANLDQVHRIITDVEADPDIVAALRSHGVTVDLV